MKKTITIEQFAKNVVTMYMMALEGEKLSPKGWKNIAKVNKIFLDMKPESLITKK